MRHPRFAVLTALLCFTVSLHGQGSSGSVPKVMEYSGNLSSHNTVVGVTFAIYGSQTDLVPLWTEIQNVTTNTTGNFSVQIGANSPGGLPVDLFASGQAQWLGITPAGGAEQPRTQITSAPYALRSVNADLLGGLPASAFLLSNATLVASGKQTIDGVKTFTNGVNGPIGTDSPDIGVFHDLQVAGAPAPWVVGHNSQTTWDGVVNDVLLWGYNIADGGSKIVQGDSSIRLAFERDYFSGGRHWAEWNLDMRPPSSNNSKRFMLLQSERDSETPQAWWYFWIGTDSKFSWCAHLPADGSGCNQLAYIDTNGVFWNANYTDNTYKSWLATLRNGNLSSAMVGFDRTGDEFSFRSEDANQPRVHFFGDSILLGGGWDTGITKVSPGTVAIGNSAVGDTSGTLLANAFVGGTNGYIGTGVGGVIGFSNDTALSRTAAGRIAVGNGSPGDTSGWLAADTIEANTLKVGSEQFAASPRSVWSSSIGATGSAIGDASARFIPDVAITITRFAVFYATPAGACAQPQVLGIYDDSAGYLTALTITPDLQHFDSGPINAKVAAGHALTIRILAGADTCAVYPASGQFNVQYRTN
jgi:hypothetical protein